MPPMIPHWTCFEDLPPAHRSIADKSITHVYDSCLDPRDVNQPGLRADFFNFCVFSGWNTSMGPPEKAARTFSHSDHTALHCGWHSATQQPVFIRPTDDSDSTSFIYTTRDGSPVRLGDIGFMLVYGCFIDDPEQCRLKSCVNARCDAEEVKTASEFNIQLAVYLARTKLLIARSELEGAESRPGDTLDTIWGRHPPARFVRPRIRNGVWPADSHDNLLGNDIRTELSQIHYLVFEAPCFQSPALPPGLQLGSYRTPTDVESFEFAIIKRM